MAIKNAQILDEKHYPDVVNEDGSVRNGFIDDDGNIRTVADGALDLAWHEGQDAALAKGVELGTVQKFFDYIPRKVFLPWLQALTEKANQSGVKLDSLEDDAKSIFERGVFVFDDIFGNIVGEVQNMHKRFGEERIYVLDKATKGIYYLSSTELYECKVNSDKKPEPIIDLGSVTAFEMGAVTTLPAGSEATATLSGTDQKPILNLGIPQGKEGARGKSGVYVGSEEPMDEDVGVWIDPDASEDDIYEYITKELAKRGQLKPEFANDISECTDTAKLYVLPDGYIYAYMSSLVYPHTNQITESISSDGTQFVGDNSEDGYIANRAMSLSTGDLYEAQGVGVTGFIPVTKGDVLNFKNYSFTPGTSVTGTGFVLYGSDFSRIDGINGTSIDTMAYLISPYSVDSDGYLTSMTICDKYSSGIAYVRFSGAGLDDSTIITKNEEISDPTKEYRWTNTRLAFVPADYEDRIIAAEESIADHEERVKVLELYGADSTSGEDIPAYIKAEADGVIDRLIENQGDHSFTFIGMSDFHYQNYAEKYPGTIEDSVDNLKRASKAAAYIMGRIHVDAVATLGDNGAFGEGTERQLVYAHRWHRQINEILGMTQQPGVVDFRTPGNHDRMGANDTAIMPDSAIYRYITGYNRQNTCFNVPGGWCYHDFTGHKLRVIMLNTAECEGKSRFNIHSGYHISNEQYHWLINALDMSGKEDAGEWQILILSHHRADDYQVTSDGSTTEYILPNILNAYKTGGSYSAEITSDGISVSCDFSEKNQARLIGQIHGHHHNYKYGHLNLGAQGNTETDIIAVGTPTTSFVTDGNDDNDGNVYTSVKDTATETAFCVYSIDLDTHKIHAIHYGNGVDREINY